MVRSGHIPSCVEHSEVEGLLDKALNMQKLLKEQCLGGSAPGGRRSCAPADVPMQTSSELCAGRRADADTSSESS
ncbi:hypothetical protein GUJ93_ZPchr0009g555 [Zizania palustris]|uniref:Uncharacterized protein n=1 Tax=Zizania palustris TaxID=103762 RepID=A0A8J5RZ32_ZIZPA|nr:hypothetical protein GUJ93_ZPchr0009g555 [Zizania palustris]